MGDSVAGPPLDLRPYCCARPYTRPRAGEAYDKVARLLGLELNPSGGAALEALAREGDPLRIK